MKCTGHRTNGEPCGQYAVRGTDRCTNHSGRAKADHIARGQVVMELSRWGLSDRTLDPGETLLRLMTQAVYRAEHYGRLLEEAYEAAERLSRSAVGSTADQVPGQKSNASDLDRAQQDLDRIFTTGGVAALIGSTYSAAGKDGYVFATGEAIRGLVLLEAAERDRAAMFATKALAAGIAERQVRLAESQGALLAASAQAFISRVVAALALDVSATAVMKREFAVMLRDLSGGQPAVIEGRQP